ncbi:MAG: SCP2 sterol-binding domain-containing protein [Clostridiales bacterium]|nr:SCP2 sterol-binding domain-containing protein [Clostridiales bacterium]
MSKETFQMEIRQLMDQGSGEMSLPQLLDQIIGIMTRNPDGMAGVTNRYRLCATDTGCTRSFSLQDGHYSELSAEDKVDVTISATEENLLALFNGKLNPAAAILKGKLKIQGSLGALTKLAALF